MNQETAAASAGRVLRHVEDLLDTEGNLGVDVFVEMLELAGCLVECHGDEWELTELLSVSATIGELCNSYGRALTRVSAKLEASQ